MKKWLILFLIGAGLAYWSLLLPNKINNFTINKKFQLDSSASRIEFFPPSQPLPSKNNLRPTVIVYPPITIIPTQQPVQDNEEWGKAIQLSDHTWTMKIALDNRMATPKEIFEALNNYRKQHNRESLNWDDRLANFAQERAANFTRISKTDEHAGFISYTDNIDNVKALGFWSLGENSSYGYRMEAVHLIEWVFAADEGHNNNQLNADWTHVGIGVDGNQADLIFGGNKM